MLQAYISFIETTLDNKYNLYLWYSLFNASIQMWFILERAQPYKIWFFLWVDFNSLLYFPMYEP